MTAVSAMSWWQAIVLAVVQGLTVYFARDIIALAEFLGRQSRHIEQLNWRYALVVAT